ncbi:heterokaryon incompatibility protein-domain-containing protein, partial [Hyaloscypha sp. PMI_1271]
SYVWGDPNDICTIFVDRKPVKITASLESALRHLREQEPGRVLCLWADALCINQPDVLERNRQVQQMGAIYSTAHHTVIYLGLSTTEIDFAFEQLQLNPAPGSMIRLDGSSPEELTAIWNILGTCVLTKPWFKRVWVFQELVLSHDPWLQCGTRRIRWDKFCEILSAIETKCTNVASHALGTVDVTEKPGPDMLRPLHDMQTRRHAFHYTTKNNGDNVHHNSLLDLLSLRRGLGASDMRDLIFAHLGLAADYRQDPKALSVDYTLSCTQVFAEAARYMIEQGALEKVLEHIWDVETAHRLPGLPSWTPDWTLAKSGRMVPKPSSFCITKALEAAVSFTPWTQIPMRLICAGWEIASVARLSKPLSFLEKPQDEVRNAWLDVLNDSNIYHVAESEEDPGYQNNYQIFVALYNELLQIFGFDVQHLSLPPGFMGSFVSDSFRWHKKRIFWVLSYLKGLYHGYENIPLHPLALICLFVLGLGSMLRRHEDAGVLDTAIEKVLSLDGNRLGLLDVNIIKSNKKKRRHTMDMGRDSCFAEMPFGLFPGLAKEDDGICMFSGCEKLYVCRPIEKSEDEDDGEHLIILGECYIDRFIILRYNPTELLATDFIFH